MKNIIFVTIVLAVLSQPAIVLASVAVNDPFFSEQTYLQQIRVPEVWGITQGSKDVVVAVIDTGIDRDHPDLEANIWINEDEIPDNGIDDDKNGYIDDRFGYDFDLDDPRIEAKLDLRGFSVKALSHGTVIAGIIAAIANNNQGIAGIAPKVKIMGLKALNGTGSGDSSDVSKAIRYAVDNGASIINMSFVGKNADPLLRAEIEYAYNKGVIIVAAAGNDANKPGVERGDLDKNPLYPVCFDSKAEGKNWILGVVSVNDKDEHSVFSSYGNNCVDIAAPGENIFSTQIWNTKIRGLEEPYSGDWNGTSFAAPMVSGAAALVKSAFPKLTNRQIYEALIINSDNIEAHNQQFSLKLGFGRLNISQTFQALQQVYAQVTNSPRQEVVLKQPQYIVVGADAGEQPFVSVYDVDGGFISRFLSFSRQTKSGVDFVVGDMDGDGAQEIIVWQKGLLSKKFRVFTPEGDMIWEFSIPMKPNQKIMQIKMKDVVSDEGDELLVLVRDGKGARIFALNEAGEILKSIQLNNTKFAIGSFEMME